MNITSSLAALTLSSALFVPDALAQFAFGESCAGASGATPVLATTGIVRTGQTWSLEVRAAGGLGLGYLLIGFSNQSSSVLGGQALPLALDSLFGDALWSGCMLHVDPSYLVQPYVFDPSSNGGLVTFDFPGFDRGRVFFQAVNLDPDYVTRIAGVSRGMSVTGKAPPSLVAIVPGTFEMGSNAPNAAPYFNTAAQQPVHTVTLDDPFWMGTFEVTNDEFEAQMGYTPSVYWQLTSRPVESVTWHEALSYCQKLTAQETQLGNVPAGYEFRLPTEAEWEYACRAGTTTEFSVGAALDCTDAHIGVSDHSGANCGWPYPEAVGRYAPNAFGLYDMHGNVEEWCLDAYAPYSAAAVTNPFVGGAVTAQRVVRGGSWIGASRSSRSAARSGVNPFDTYFYLGARGFRVVLAPVLVP
jgi:formylglycine-generating enzyme required for sulfatase activity